MTQNRSAIANRSRNIDFYSPLISDGLDNTKSFDPVETEKLVTRMLEVSIIQLIYLYFSLLF
jgi:hypothetical protein